MHERYPRIYAMLKAAGHSPLKAVTIIIEAHRGDKFALQWVRHLRLTVRDTQLYSSIRGSR